MSSDTSPWVESGYEAEIKHWNTDVERGSICTLKYSGLIFHTLVKSVTSPGYSCSTGPGIYGSNRLESKDVA